MNASPESVFVKATVTVRDVSETIVATIRSVSPATEMVSPTTNARSKTVLVPVSVVVPFVATVPNPVCDPSDSSL